MIRLYILLIMLFMVSGCQWTKPKPTILQASSNDYIARVKINDISVRLLILKHCPDAVADTDSGQAIRAARLAASKGLAIKDIGNHRIDKNGKTDRLVWGKKINTLDGLKQFISEQMKVDAKPGDTLIIYTLGHGGGNGYIMRLGQRAGVMKIIAEAAEENEQETIWWQMSCHAAANLPPISSLTEKQQDYFSMTASSPGNKLSYFNTQGAQFQKLFLAMAEKSTDIDPNQDNIITAGELRNFMIKHFGRERGELVFARNDNEPLFGLQLNIINRIPIIDINGHRQDRHERYIPIP